MTRIFNNRKLKQKKGIKILTRVKKIEDNGFNCEII